MIALGPLAFTAPLALLGLIALPFIWWVLRATPPSPQEIRFAPLRLLKDLARTPETAQTTPWWLILLRLFLAGVIIFALARPVLQPDPVNQNDDPLLIVMDDGWAGAQSWSGLEREARIRLDAARAAGRDTALLFTAAPSETPPITFGPAGDNLARLAAHEPRAWASDRGLTAERVVTLMNDPATPRRIQVVWIADGLESPDDEILSRALANLGALTVLLPPRTSTVHAIAALTGDGDGFTAEIIRPASARSTALMLTAISADGRAVARTQGQFEPGQTRLEMTVRLPLELRNQIARVELGDGQSAGLIHLTGDRWRKPRVGLVDPEGGREGQPLLSDTHYAGQALGQSGEVMTGELDELIEAEPSALVLIDSARIETETLDAYMAEGGMVIRFAGPRMAASPDEFLPVRLREGGRLFGGALAWDDPQGLAAFADDSPFAGLSIPEEAQVESQVLAEPGPDLSSKVWARLDDGTPLVTAERRGNGWLVLYHITAGPDWSSLPLSGLFPAMLERTLALSGTNRVTTPTDGAWRLDRQLAGTGRLNPPTTSSLPIQAEDWAAARATASTPPGIWALGAASAALNAVQEGAQLTEMNTNLPGAITALRGETREIRFAGPLLTLAVLFFIADMIIALILSGRMPRFAGLAIIVLVLVPISPPIAEAQTQERTREDYLFSLDNALDVRLAYIETGNPRIDAMSRAGLTGLSRESTRRSAVEPAEPVGVDIETDDIVYFPLIYWPVSSTSPPLSDEAAAKVSAYLQSGGLLVFDTQDGQIAGMTSTPNPGLVRILEAVNPPPLQRIPKDHVLGRTFYLLSEFPGRYGGGEVWVESTPEGSARDGVSGLIIGSADWASAWAVDENGRTLAPVEGGEFQRELSIRFGVNLAMYALTGNYKADQVHVPAILERLGRDQE